MEMDRDVVNLIHRLRWEVVVDWGSAHEWLFCDADTPVDADAFLADTGNEIPPQLRNFVRAVDNQMKDLPVEEFMFGYPLHEEPRNPGDSRFGFVAMPYGPHWFEPVKNVILAAGNQVGFDCIVSIDVSKPGSILDQIWRQTRRAEVVVADLTGANPNVYYEVGLAHALGKQTIFITQEAGDVPFDVSTSRYFVYDVNDLPALEAELIEAFRAVAPRYDFDRHH